MEYALNSHSLCDLHEHWSIVDEDCLLRPYLSDVESQPKDVRIGLTNVNEAGGYEAVCQPVQLESLDPICIQLTRFIADDRYLQPRFSFS